MPEEVGVLGSALVLELAVEGAAQLLEVVALDFALEIPNYWM